MATAELLRININFYIEELIQKEDLEKKIKGYYTLEIIMDNKHKEFEIDIKNFDDMIKFMKDFIKSKDINIDFKLLMFVIHNYF